MDEFFCENKSKIRLKIRSDFRAGMLAAKKEGRSVCTPLRNGGSFG